MAVVPLNARFHRARALSGEEVWRAPRPPSEMVWELCPYLRMSEDESRCRQCPEWETDPHYGKVQRGCYALSQEACRVVLAMRNAEYHMPG